MQKWDSPNKFICFIAEYLDARINWVGIIYENLMEIATISARMRISYRDVLDDRSLIKIQHDQCFLGLHGRKKSMTCDVDTDMISPRTARHVWHFNCLD